MKKFEDIAQKLAPESPLYLYSRLFSGRDIDLYEDTGNYDEQLKKLEEKRQNTIIEILDFGNFDDLIKFAESVESSLQVGISFGDIAEPKYDSKILPNMIDTKKKKITEFVNGYVRSCKYKRGWSWVDGIVKSDWSIIQMSKFLSYLPFNEKTWERVNKFLKDSDGEYWKITPAKPSETGEETGLAVDKLIESGRPYAALNCIYIRRLKDDSLDIPRTLKALYAGISSTFIG